MIVIVTDSDAPFDSPAYEGPADMAHTVLAAGNYTATIVSQDDDLDGTEVGLRVSENSSAVDAIRNTKTL